MRRRDREITDINEIKEVIQRGRVCHLAMSFENKPYVIPMIYAYDPGENTLYFHCAEVGQKLDFIRANGSVCCEIQNSVTDKVVENSDKPCDWGIGFESVIAFGTAEIVDDREMKIKAYDNLVKKMMPKGYIHEENSYVEKKLKGTFIIKVPIESMSGKKWNGIK